MDKPSFVRHRSQTAKPEPIQQELSEPNELESMVEQTYESQSPNPNPLLLELNEPILQELSDSNELDFAVEQTQMASAVPIYSKGFDASVTDEIREEIKNGDGSTFFFDFEDETFPESFSQEYVDFLHSYE